MMLLQLYCWVKARLPKWQDERGDGVVTYVILVAVLAAVTIVAVTKFGTALTGAWDRLTNQVNSVGN